MYFHQAMAEALGDHDIDVVFGVLGDANLYMMDSFRRAGGSFYSTANEAGAVLAANGFARTSGGMGVATVTHGPALTNTLTALTESVKDGTPVLLIAGDTAVVDRDNLQATSQREHILPTGAGFEQLRSPETLAEDLATAVRRCRLERRPVVLNVPVDFQWRETERVVSPVRWVEAQRTGGDDDALDDAAAVLASARRPVVLAGGGMANARSREALLMLASRTGAPLATTLRGIDLFRGHPHDLGLFGTLSHEVAMDVIGRADCVIAFGASLNAFTTVGGSLLENKRVVQVDCAPSAIGRFAPVDAGVVGDGARVAVELASRLDDAGIKASGFASSELSARLAAHHSVVEGDASSPMAPDGIDLAAAMRRIDESFPSERTLVHDAGRFVYQALRTMHAPGPRAYVHTINFGSIGLGVGNAIGAYIGAPGRPVLLTVGDGGFMLGGLAEFNTAVRHGVDLVVMLFNDGAYGAEHIQFRNKDMDPLMSMFDWPDFAPVADALGGKGYTVRTMAELDEALETLKHRDRPVLVDIKIDPDSVVVPDR